MNIFSCLFMTIGGLFLLYFIIIVIYTKAKTAFGGFFLTIGICLLALAKVYQYLEDRAFGLNDIIEKVTLLFLFVGIYIFFSILRMILTYGKSSCKINADYLIILGARINGSRITKSLRYRLDAAYEYMEKNPQTMAIVSGGRGEGENITEAQAMKEYLVARGIVDNRILMEDQSTDTNENIQFSKRLLDETNKTVVIVTNSFHLYRAINIAKKQGFSHVEGIGAPSDRVLVLSYYIREVIAVLKDKVLHNMV